MTEKEKEKKVLDVLGLKVGDKVLLNHGYKAGWFVYEIIECKNYYALKLCCDGSVRNLSDLIDHDFTTGSNIFEMISQTHL